MHVQKTDLCKGCSARYSGGAIKGFSVLEYLRGCYSEYSRRFCREADLETWHTVAGWRGLKDERVQRWV